MVPMMIMIPVVAIALTPSCILDSWRLRHSPLHRLVQLRQNRHIAGCKKYVPGLVFNSIVNDSRLLKAHLQTSKICLLLLMNLLQIYYRFAFATIYDRADCRSWLVGVGRVVVPNFAQLLTLK